MSSAACRTEILNFLDSESEEDVVDLTALYGELDQELTNAGISPDSPWLGVRFVGDDEIPVSLAATNDQGMYRESGAIYFDIVDVAKLGGGNSLLTRAETLRNLLMGQRIGSTIIQSVSLPNFDAGTTLQFEGGWMSGSFICGYIRDRNL